MNRFNQKSVLLILLTFLAFRIVNGQFVTHHDPVYQANILKPNVKTPYFDPKFNSQVMRITDAKYFPTAGTFPQYSKRQAWNADETKILFISANGQSYLYDALTYNYIKVLIGLEGEDIFWHSTNPNLLIFSPDSIIKSYDITSDNITEIKLFPQYTWVNTRGEGNLSRDGRYYAFVGQTYDTCTHFIALNVFDFQLNSVISTLALPHALESFDWVSISPLGNYVVVDYATSDTGRYQGVEVYDRNLNFIWQKPLGYGHSDLTIDQLGDEVLIMDYYDDQTNSTFVKKIKLSDGTITNLIEFSWMFDCHISCRNEERSEWCFISTFDGEARLTHDSLSWLPFEDEIFAVKLDGSGDVQRIAHHHSRRFSPTTPDRDNSVYWAEPHATINRSGTKILFGSNWSQDVEIDTSVDAYVVDFSSLLNVDKETNLLPKAFQLFQNFPNPFNPTTKIRYTIPVSPLNQRGDQGGLITLKVYNTLGQEIATLVNKGQASGTYEVEFDGSKLSSGIYFYSLMTDENIEIKKMLLLK
ncbi:MAG: T9SS type A sorting domain-containing protein [Ignavibacteriales bacterium]|nr:T9SS type A sorting domain-containing protein [Ignavibacteriales bacterium]